LGGIRDLGSGQPDPAEVVSALPIINDIADLEEPEDLSEGLLKAKVSSSMPGKHFSF
jgi:hypothetical protein